MTDAHENSIAVIGMAGRFPGAPDLTSYWSNLTQGIESIRQVSDDDLRESGVSAEMIANPSYVKAYPAIEDATLFDARYFNLSAKEVEYIDPQHRLFLECAVHALENAGCDPKRYDGNVGVFGGTNPNAYQFLALRHRILSGSHGSATKIFEGLESDLMFFLGGDKDYLATRVSYKLDLRGPSLTVQTACSTSLVAVHLACQSLLSGECEVALAGGVSATPGSYLKVGYMVYPGMTAPDGRCRPFDHRANGTVFGDGVGIVVLKRLDRALAEGDNIRAIIRGSAINNDGSSKVGYAAPSLEGQASVVVEAHAVAGLSASTISYVEAHGTGTPLGDPIEVASLTRAFRKSSDKAGFCGLGSVKSNVGHLNTAAGVAGLMKVVLALENECLPPSINFEAPNEQIQFEQTPFYVVSALEPWRRSDVPRRAGVNAFGIGGTNAHIVVEEAPLRRATAPSRRAWHILPISAKTDSALEHLSNDLLAHLSSGADAEIADVAHTLANGRSFHRIRRAVVCDGPASAIESLRSSPGRSTVASETCPAYFMFPGQGSQRINMGQWLYHEEPAYRSAFDSCVDGLKRFLGEDLRAIVFPRNGASDDAAARLTSTEFAQPAIFSVSYALAALWRSRGIEPAGMIGHSIGEVVAACIAGVFSLDDALKVVVERGRLMQRQPSGRMLAVPAPLDEVERFLEADLSVAAVNGPSAVVVSGPATAIAELADRLGRQGIISTELHTSHAFHSAMMEGAVKPFVDVMRGISLRAPRIPYVSNVSGTWVTAEQATDPEYWGEQLRAPVRFADGIRAILDNNAGVLIEAGPGRALSALARQSSKVGSGPTIVASMPQPGDARSEVRSFSQALADVWTAGCEIRWETQYRDERRAKVVLPNYPFERERIMHTITPPSAKPERAGVSRISGSRPQEPDYLLAPYWRASNHGCGEESDLSLTGQCWLVFAGTDGLGQSLVEELRAKGADVVVVRIGRKFEIAEREITLSSVDIGEFERLFGDLVAWGLVPQHIVYLWSLDAPPLELGNLEAVLDKAFFGLMYLVQAIDRSKLTERISIASIVSRSVDVLGGESVDPTGAIVRGPWMTAPIEHKNISCLYIDIPEASARAPVQGKGLVQRLISDIAGRDTPALLAYRQGRAWTVAVERVALKAPDESRPMVRPGGVYLITGGFGDIGLALASAFAEQPGVKLVLCGRTRLPERAEWDQYLAGTEQDARVARTLTSICEIESKGARVFAGTADVSDLDAMRDMLEKARAEFGQINGVVHAAGLPGHNIIVTRTKERALPILLPKIAGALVIDELLGREPLDFIALFSSLSAVTGGVGMVDYVAGNAYLDAFACGRNARGQGTRIVSINWDIWSEIGMATHLPKTFKGSGTLRLEDGVSTSEGIDALMRSVQSGLPQVIVSKNLSRELRARAGTVWRSVEGTDPDESAGSGDRASVSRARPEISARYVEPSNEIERVIAEFWAGALDIERVGVDDDFFELGGDSLLAMQMIPKLISRFEIELAPRDLFEGGTVAGIARVIEAKLIDEVELAET